MLTMVVLIGTFSDCQKIDRPEKSGNNCKYSRTSSKKNRSSKNPP